MNARSDDPAAIMTGLRAALSGERPDWNASFDTLVAETWRALHTSGPNAILTARDHIAPLAARIDRTLPEPGPPPAEAARALALWERILRVGADVHTRHHVDQSLLQPGTIEHNILYVLWQHRNEPLQRGEIHDRLPEAGRKSATRTHQVLEKLGEVGLIHRSYAPGRGGNMVAHYQLFGDGHSIANAAFGPSPLEKSVRAVFGETYDTYIQIMPDMELSWQPQLSSTPTKAAPVAALP